MDNQQNVISSSVTNYTNNANALLYVYQRVGGLKWFKRNHFQLAE